MIGFPPSIHFSLYINRRYLDVGRDILASLQYGAKCPCGYCHISDVETHKQDDHMESFFLAETVKYLWLLFDLAVGPDNIVENGPYKYIFSTEGHLLPATPEIALVDEHCLYFGAFCNGSTARGYGKDDISSKQQTSNYTQFDDRQTASSHYSISNVLFATKGYIKGVCPGLNHAQKLGISYYDGEDSSEEQNSRGHENPDETYVVESSVQTQSSSVILMSHPVTSQPDESLKTRSRTQHHENIVVIADSEPMRTDSTGGSSEGDTVSISEQIEVADEEIVPQDQNEESTS